MLCTTVFEPTLQISVLDVQHRSCLDSITFRSARTATAFFASILSGGGYDEVNGTVPRPIDHLARICGACLTIGHRCGESRPTCLSWWTFLWFMMLADNAGLVFGSITFRGACTAISIFTFNSFMWSLLRRKQPCQDGSAACCPINHVTCRQRSCDAVSCRWTLSCGIVPPWMVTASCIPGLVRVFLEYVLLLL